MNTCFFCLWSGQFGFVPLDCEVSARAVSGVIQSKELLKAEKRVIQHILNSGNLLSKSLGDTSTFRGDLEPSANHMNGRKEGRFLGSTLLRKGSSKSHKDDPVAMMLAHTFKAMDLNSSLDNAVNGQFLLSSKVPQKNTDGTYSGVRAIDGLLKATLPVIPKGPGSGLVFDAGAQWLSNQTSINYKKKLGKSRKKGDVNITSETSEALVSGLRIPFKLDTVQSVSFVLTQEAGKLKPKDLKIAIDRNRAEREARAEEQEKIREQGGGSGMDLKGIVAEDRLNSSSSGDPLKRQLREMAFLADVDDVHRQELEKEFRVSDEFCGAIPLTGTEIEEILHQRQMLAMRKKRTEWKATQSMQHTMSYAPSHAEMKAGTSVAVLMQALSSLTPSFNTNRNDIWTKRMNTLRYFISMVSRWIVRRRAGIRLAKIKAKLSSVMADDNGIQQLSQTDVALPGFSANSKVLNKAQRSARKELVRAWIDDENSSNRLAATFAAVGVGVPPLTTLGGRMPSQDDSCIAFDQCSSVAELVCAADHEAIVRRQRSELVTATLRFDMASQPAVQRILFPKCLIEEGNALQPLKSPGIEILKQFDDRALFQLKIRPEYTAMRYTQHKIPEVPIFYPTGKDKIRRIGAPEEHFLRPSADLYVGLEAILRKLPPEPPGIASMRSAMAGAAAASALLEQPQLDIEVNRKSQYAAPSWLLDGYYGDEWTAPELDFFKVRSDLRSYNTPSHLAETDADWIFRPFAPEDSLVYKDDESIRSR